MTVSDIAELAGVQRSTVSNWQRRHDEFPAPLPDSPPGRPQFNAAAVREWLAERYPDKVGGNDGADEIVRNWRYTTNDVQCDDATDPLTLLIAAIQGEHITYWEGGYDERYPMSIGADHLDTKIRATKSQAAAIREFLETEISEGGVDKAALIERAAQEFDELDRWRRTPEALSAQRNLHNLLAGLVHEESTSVLDFACGTGSLLLATCQKHSAVKLVGMEPDLVKAFIADARLAQRANTEIAIDADILEVDALKGRVFDAVVSIPPFGRKVDLGNERMRRLPFGPVRGSADAAWPQLAIQALSPDGEAFLVLPHTLAFEDRSDQIRRELIQQGRLAAVVTLPSNALPASKSAPHLWILSNRRDPTSDVLFVDYSMVDPTDTQTYGDLAHTLCNWLDDPSGETALPPDDPRFVAVTPIKLLGPTVILDPQYWCAHVATPTSAPELIEMVEDATATLDQARQRVLVTDIPACRLVADRPAMITVREARDDMWVKMIRRGAGRRDQTSALDNVAGIEPPKLRIHDADLMWRGEDGVVRYVEAKASHDSSHSGRNLVELGDVLVWATPDRQVRATVSTAGGFAPSHEITVLRCDPEKLNPHYLALSLASGRNSIHVTASNLPGLRPLDLSFPLIPMEQQNQLANYAQAAYRLRAAAQAVASAAEAFWQTLADATGSGSVGTSTNGRDE